MFKNKNILITGGTGSVGKVLCKYFYNENIGNLIIFSRDEYKQYLLKKDYPNIICMLGDIRNYNSIKKATKNINFIIHTAALKHVDICENNPEETIDINIIGSKNIINCSIENNVEKVLFISTDKATNPNNTYGASKLLADKLCIDGNKYGNTRFSVIRFGNIFGSRGSFIETLFKSKNFDTINLTNENIARVFISWKELLKNIIYCLKNMYGGEIFIPKSKSIYIKDIINKINDKLEISYCDLRDGEKLIEILLSPDDVNNTIEKDSLYIIISKYCKDYYSGYTKIDNNTKYTSISNKFYNDDEIFNLINEIKIL